MILNYAVTSNHIHLLVVGGKKRDVIPNSIKLIAGRTGQEFNQRKNRKGAFWQDRYHATAIERGDHLLRIPADSVHLFRANPSTRSDPFRPLIPI